MPWHCLEIFRVYNKEKSQHCRLVKRKTREEETVTYPRPAMNILAEVLTPISKGPSYPAIFLPCCHPDRLTDAPVAIRPAEGTSVLVIKTVGLLNVVHGSRRSGKKKGRRRNSGRGLKGETIKLATLPRMKEI